MNTKTIHPDKLLLDISFDERGISSGDTPKSTSLEVKKVVTKPGQDINDPFLHNALFDGNADKVISFEGELQSSGKKKFTIDFWINTTQFKDKVVFTIDTDYYHGIRTFINGLEGGEPTLVVGCNGKYTGFELPKSILKGGWTHWTLAIDTTGKSAIWMNGERKLLKASFTDDIFPQNKGTKLHGRIGANMNNDKFWEGELGRLRVWQTKLTDAEIEALHKSDMADFKPPSKANPLQAYFKMNLTDGGKEVVSEIGSINAVISGLTPSKQGAEGQFVPWLKFPGNTNQNFEVPGFVFANCIAELTVGCWLKMDDTKQSATILQLNGTGSHKLLVGYNNGEIELLETGGAPQQNAKVSSDNKWHYISLTHTRETKLWTLYFDGKPLLKLTAKTQFTAIEKLIVGKYEQYFFKGDLAIVRIWDKALTAPQIMDLYTSDQGLIPKQTQSVLPCPIQFKLMDKDEQPVIYIGAKEELKWNISNSSKNKIYFNKIADTPAPDNFHFELRFRPGTLLNDGKGITIDAPNWAMSEPQVNPNHTVSFYFVHNSTDPLNPKEHLANELSLMLHNTEGSPGSEGARGTRVELYYKNVRISEDQNLEGVQIQTVNLVNHYGHKEIGLRAAIDGSNTVLNDGVKENTFTVFLYNISQETITLKKDLSKIAMRFDQGTQSYNLGGADLKDTVIKEDGTNEIKPTTESMNNVWIYAPKQDVEIKAGGSIKFVVSNLKTSYSSGLCYMYFDFSDIPDFWDTGLRVELNKELQFFETRNGTTGYVSTRNNKEDESEELFKFSDYYHGSRFLHVSTAAGSKYTTGIQFRAMDEKNGFNIQHEDGNGPSKNYNLNILRYHNNSQGESAMLIDKKTGNVGVNQTKPQTTLDVNGTIQGTEVHDQHGVLIPPGTIWMFNGQVAPKGWAICNGEGGTPDLRGRCLIGAGMVSYVDQKGHAQTKNFAFKEAGGMTDVMLKEGQMPQHKHDVKEKSPGHSHKYASYHSVGFKTDSETNGNDRNRITIDGNETAKTTIKIDESLKGSSESHPNMPPYLALNYIIKL